MSDTESGGVSSTSHLTRKDFLSAIKLISTEALREFDDFAEDSYDDLEEEEVHGDLSTTSLYHKKRSLMALQSLSIRVKRDIDILKLRSQHSGNRAQTMPFEILAEIFRYACGFSDTKGDTEIGYGRLMRRTRGAIASTCSHWRQVALSCTHLWSNIVVWIGVRELDAVEEEESESDSWSEMSYTQQEWSDDDNGSGFDPDSLHEDDEEDEDEGEDEAVPDHTSDVSEEDSDSGSEFDYSETDPAAFPDPRIVGLELKRAGRQRLCLQVRLDRYANVGDAERLISSVLARCDALDVRSSEMDIRGLDVHRFQHLFHKLRFLSLVEEERIPRATEPTHTSWALNLSAAHDLEDLWIGPNVVTDFSNDRPPLQRLASLQLPIPNLGRLRRLSLHLVINRARVLDALRMCPKLETLYISLDCDIPNEDDTPLVELPELLHLSIGGWIFDSILDYLEIPKLQDLTIRNSSRLVDTTIPLQLSSKNFPKLRSFCIRSIPSDPESVGRETLDAFLRHHEGQLEELWLPRLRFDPEVNLHCTYDRDRSAFLRTLLLSDSNPPQPTFPKLNRLAISISYVNYYQGPQYSTEMISRYFEARDVMGDTSSVIHLCGPCALDEFLDPALVLLKEEFGSRIKVGYESFPPSPYDWLERFGR